MANDGSLIAVALTAVNANAITADPAGTTVTQADYAVITPKKARKVVLRVKSTGTCTLTVKAGQDPPSPGALVGDLTLTIGNATKFFTLEAAKYLQSNGTLKFLVNTTDALVTAFALDKSH